MSIKNTTAVEREKEVISSFWSQQWAYLRSKLTRSYDIYIVDIIRFCFYVFRVFLRQRLYTLYMPCVCVGVCVFKVY